MYLLYVTVNLNNLIHTDCYNCHKAMTSVMRMESQNSVLKNGICLKKKKKRKVNEFGKIKSRDVQ